MKLTSEEAVRQLSDILAYHLPKNIYDSKYEIKALEVFTQMMSAKQRLVPPNSHYDQYIQEILDAGGCKSYMVKQIGAILKALEKDFRKGYLETFHELVRADLFADFLEMAEHLYETKLFGSSAVIAGCVLEEHVRKLCVKNGIDIIKTGKKDYMSNEYLNVELRKKGVYGIHTKDKVTAWYRYRSTGAHVLPTDEKKQKEFEEMKNNIPDMIKGIREFIENLPA